MKVRGLGQGGFVSFVSFVSSLLLGVVLMLLSGGCRGRRNARLHEIEDAQAEVLASATVPPPIPSTPAPLEPEPALPLPTPEENAVADATDARKNAWLSTPLSGHDNDMAAFRGVTLTRDEALGHKLVIKNQFGLTCGLKFGPDGSPIEITTKCRGSDGWGAADARIPLTCEEKETQEICRGKYTLTSPDGFKMPSVLQIVRPLKASKPKPKL